MFSTCACRSTYVGIHAGPLKLPFRPSPASADAPSPPVLCSTAAHMCNACSAAPQRIDGEVYTYTRAVASMRQLETHLTPLAVAPSRHCSRMAKRERGPESLEAQLSVTSSGMLSRHSHDAISTRSTLTINTKTNRQKQTKKTASS